MINSHYTHYTLYECEYYSIWVVYDEILMFKIKLVIDYGLYN